MEEEKIFVARCYGKAELAHLYFPGLNDKSGLQKLNRWIKRCTYLYGELMQEGFGYQPQAKAFTAREVRIIVRYLGEP